MIISIHIPRTAGTAFREVLVERLQNRLLHHYYQLMDFGMTPVDSIPEHTECIHGHFPANFYRSQFPHAATVTWVREPVARVISEYFFLRDHPDDGNLLSQLIQAGGSILDFAEHPASNNRMCWYIDGVPLSRFAFIGISEMFDLELDRLERATGLHLRKFHRSNQGRSHIGDEVGEKERRRIAEINFADTRLYEYCSQVATRTLSS